MKVRYRLTLYGDLAKETSEDPRDIYKVHESSIEFCCESISKAWGNAVTLGDINAYPRRPDLVGIYDCEPCKDDFPPEFYPISFCPFCGTTIDKEADDELFTMRKHETTETVTRAQYKPEKVETLEEVFSTEI